MPARNLRFLVVEDQEFQRTALVRLLQVMGAEAVHSAEDGVAALKIIRDPDRPVDVVISDLSMPGMDGMELIRNLSETGERVSLIVASALDSDLLAAIANMARAYKVKLLGVIGKPPTAVKLTPLIELHRSAHSETTSSEGLFPLSDIAEAWTHNDFELWYEPKVDLTRGIVQGMEASPRWLHPTDGLLLPETFMPSVRARGLNDDFTWLMLQKSAAQCRLWLDKGLELQVSVDLSFNSLTEGSMAARIRRIVQSENLDPRYLVLGVTESALNTEHAKALENLARLRVDGFGLAITDFGAGSMDIGQLSLVAFTELKIHRSFVMGTDADDTAKAGLAASLDVAHQLKLKTVADGIRSKEEWVLLQSWGCEVGQGPFISQPIKGDAVAGWIAKWSRATIK